MRERYKNALMWGLYAALVLLILVLQTVSFGRPRFFGVKLCFVPVLVACVSMHVGSEAGCVFGMVCGLVWTLSGADGGAMHIVLLALCGAVAGYLCDRYLVRNLVSALLMRSRRSRYGITRIWQRWWIGTLSRHSVTMH